MQKAPIEVVFEYYLSKGGMVTDFRTFHILFNQWLSRIGQTIQPVYLFVLKQS